MTALPGGTVTFLFSDIEGSTRLVKALRERYADVLAEHRGLVRAAVAGHGGHEVDTQGDAFFIAFGGAKQAVLCAVEIQRALAAHDWPVGGQVRVRIGIHTGQAVLAGRAYTGLAVHRAARICAAASGGQVLVSEATQAMIEEEGELGFALTEPDDPRLQEALQKARQALSPAQASAAEDRGAAFSVDIAAEYALMLTVPGLQQPAGTSQHGQLSRRERELVTLVAQGRTDAQIAGQLHISIRTVRWHLDRIRDKTGCRRRADLTRLASAPSWSSPAGATARSRRVWVVLREKPPLFAGPMAGLHTSCACSSHLLHLPGVGLPGKPARARASRSGARRLAGGNCDGWR